MNTPGGSSGSWWSRRRPRSRGLSYALAAGWLLLAVLGVVQLLVGDDAAEWWLAGLEIAIAVALGVTFLVDARSADVDRAGR
jgi:hypothetical protein